MFCTKCGSLAPEGASFCRNCGQPLGLPEARASEPSHPSLTLETVPVPPVPAAVSTITAPPVTVSLPAPYAGFWLRLVAYLIDSAIVAVAFGAIVALAVGGFGVRFFRGFVPRVYDQPPNPLFPVAILGVILVLLPLTIVLTWLYFASMESSTHQGTLGKMALGLFVTDLQGRRVSFGRASGRFFAKFITGLIPFFIGYIMAGFTAKKQALHDMIASCLVLKKV
jgi:uncharacterized RDD family membrane protein YckC